MADGDSTEHEGLRIARERIAREAEERTGVLDLGMLGLTLIPKEIFQLDHPLRLSLTNSYFSFFRRDWNIFHIDAQRDRSSCPNEFDKNLIWLSRIPNLIGLDISDCQVSRLSFLRDACALKELNCSFTKITTLSFVQGLRSLTKIHASSTRIRTLRHLSQLDELEELHVAETGN